MLMIRLLLLFFFVISLNATNLLTKEEQEWIKQNPVIKVGVDNNWPPFDFIDANKHHSGISSEYLKTIAYNTGLKFEIYSNTWSEVLKNIQNKELDILACVSKTELRKDYLDFTKAYISFDTAVVARKNFDLEAFNDIQKYRIAVPKDTFVHELLKTKFPNATFIFTKSNEEALKYISYKKADIYVGNLPIISNFIEKDLLTNIEIKFKTPFVKSDLSFAVLKEKKILFSIMDKSLSMISEKEKSNIQNRWIDTKFQKKIDINENVISKEEKLWLLNHGELKFSGDPHWPPYSFYNENNEYVGIVPDLVNEIFKDKDIDIKYEKTTSWNETLNLIKTNKIDMIDALSVSKSRLEYLNFSTTYIGAEIVIIANSLNDKYVNNIKKISNKKIATVKGYSIVEKVKLDYPEVNEFILFSNPLEGLKKLSSSQIDYFILDIPSFEYYSKKHGLSNLKIVGPTGYDYKYGFGILKSHDELLPIMNKLLSLVSQERKNEIYRKWIRLDYHKRIDYDLIWKIIVIAFFVILGTVYWNRKLQIEIADKKKTQKELEKKNLRIEKILKIADRQQKELMNLNHKLEESTQIAENATKQKSEFLANMSHEIRTPMNSVIGFTELLDKEIINPVQKDYLNSIKRGGHALLGIINDILDLSKIEAGKLEIRNESLNPTNLFLEIESIFHAKIISKNINFEIEIDKSIPEYIIIDSVRIRQILFNLIGNAIKFTEKGSIKLKVQNLFKNDIKSKIDLIFTIEDTGMGIGKEDLENIFNAFEQQKGQSNVKYGGTGLGLAICSKLVKMMNGKIEVESKKGKGSIFRVVLYDIAVSSISHNIIVEKIDFSNIVFEKASILVVDDISENRKLVKASLKNFDFEIIMAENGKEAIDILNNIKIDLIFMDLRMPVMNGYEAASIIKNDKKLKKIPLIALTASVMEKDLKKVSKYGFDAYLRKPVILDDLIEEISNFLKYDFINEKSSMENLSEDIEIDIDKLKYIIGKLDTEFKLKWNEVKDKGDFSLIESFVDELEELSNEYKIMLLANYIKELKMHLESFDIEKVDYLMNMYLNLISNLKERFKNE